MTKNVFKQRDARRYECIWEPLWRICGLRTVQMPPWYRQGLDPRTLMDTKIPGMFKCLIQNCALLASNLCTSFHSLWITFRLLIIPTTMKCYVNTCKCFVNSWLCGKFKFCILKLSRIKTSILMDPSPLVAWIYGCKTCRNGETTSDPISVSQMELWRSGSDFSSNKHEQILLKQCFKNTKFIILINANEKR